MRLTAEKVHELKLLFDDLEHALQHVAPGNVNQLAFYVIRKLSEMHIKLALIASSHCNFLTFDVTNTISLNMTQLYPTCIVHFVSRFILLPLISIGTNYNKAVEFVSLSKLISRITSRV